jgi:hypothetical protein
MPIDPQIPLGALAGMGQVPAFNPLAVMQSVEQMKATRAMAQEREAQARIRQQALADDQAMRQYVTETGGDLYKAADLALTKGQPMIANKLRLGASE